MATSTATRGWRSLPPVTMMGVLLIAGAANARAEGSFSVRPGQSNPNDPATRAYFKPVLRPGRSVTQAVIVANSGTKPVHLLVYAVDGLTGQTTGTVYANRSDRVRKAGRWVKPALRQVTVAPGQQVTVPFTVRAPKRTKPGDHVAGIAFEDANHRTAGAAFRIIQILREVVGVQIQVPGRASPSLTLGQAQLKQLPGTPLASVVLPLGNAGLKLCKPRLAVAVRGPHHYSHRVARPLDTVLPGDDVAYPLPWTGRLASGRYTTSASVSCLHSRAASVSTVTLGRPLGSNATSPVASANTGSKVPPWVFILVGLAGVGAGVTLTYVRMARRHRAALAAAAEQARVHPSVSPSAEAKQATV